MTDDARPSLHCDMESRFHLAESAILAGDAQRLATVLDACPELVTARSAKSHPRVYAASWGQDLTEVLRLDPTDAQSGASFGRHVAVHAQTIIVGATGQDNVGQGYRFDRGTGDWEQASVFAASDATPGDIFGLASAIAPGVITFGSPLGDAGAVYVYPTGPAGPGTVPAGSLRVARSALSGTSSSGALVLSWGAGCGRAADDYGIYEGTMGDWVSHSFVACRDVDHDFREEIPMHAGSRYYLVVPNSPSAEGSYGRDGTAAERPVGLGTCRAVQTAAQCL